TTEAYTHSRTEASPKRARKPCSEQALQSGCGPAIQELEPSGCGPRAREPEPPSMRTCVRTNACSGRSGFAGPSEAGLGFGIRGRPRFGVDSERGLGSSSSLARMSLEVRLVLSTHDRFPVRLHIEEGRARQLR